MVGWRIDKRRHASAYCVANSAWQWIRLDFGSIRRDSRNGRDVSLLSPAATGVGEMHDALMRWALPCWLPEH